jgi:hypothetical protein
MAGGRKRSARLLMPKVQNLPSTAAPRLNESSGLSRAIQIMGSTSASSSETFSLNENESPDVTRAVGPFFGRKPPENRNGIPNEAPSGA